MSIQKVDVLTAPPVVGQYYLVPIVHGMWCGRTAWYAVMGEKHEDSKFFNFEKQHYHLDRRFLPNHKSDDAVAKPFHDMPVISLSAPKLGLRKCQQVMIPFPIYPKQVRAMQRHLAGAQCQAHATGWVCPHRGFRLGSIEAVDGIIRCPLHGLQIDAASGVVIGEK